MKEEDNIYLKALKYGSKRETFLLSDIVKDLNLTDEQKKILFFQIKEKAIFHYNGNKSHFEEKFSLSMSVEDTFRLLEYTELKEARRSD